MIVNGIEINSKQILEDLNFSSGNFKLVYNLFENIIGSNTGERLYIQEISPSRTEIRVKPINQDLNNEDWFNFNLIPQKDKMLKYAINFGNNNIIYLTNWIYDSQGPDDLLGSYILKLYAPLSTDFSEKDQLWIVKIIANPLSEEINLETIKEVEQSNSLKGPNFNIGVGVKNNTPTTYKTWNDVLSTDSVTSEKLVNKYLSGSVLEGIKLNIDYSDFNNFVHFGSANERLANFYYKMGLIESYNYQIGLSTGSANALEVTESRLSYENKRNALIGGFDGYERYMYYDSSSYSVNTYGTHSAATWPKNGTWPNYTNYSVTNAEEWYVSQSVRATEYDRGNLNNLINTLPFSIRENDYNSEYLSFVYMVGQYFDILWSYIKNLNQIYSRENDINLGLAKELLYPIMSSLGVNVNNGNSLVDLWEYAFGHNSSCAYSNTGSLHSLSKEDITSEIWNRLLNNLPYLLKTKGTQRGIRALINCYGIPSSMLTIKEYGGPNISGSDFKSTYDTDRFEGELVFHNGEQVIGTWNPSGSRAKAIELRFKINNQSFASENTIFELYSIHGSTLKIKHSGSLTGWLEYEDSGSKILSSSMLPLYNGDFWNTMLTATGSLFSLYVNQTEKGTINYENNTSSIMDSSSWNYDPSFKLAAGSFTGSLQEFRMWNRIPTQNDFNNHSKFVRAINITGGDPYVDIATRYTFNDPKNHGSDSSVLDKKPNQNWLNNGTAQSFSSVTDYPFNYSSSNIDVVGLVPNLGITETSNKTRIETNYLSGSLDPDVSSDIHSYDNAPIDSNKLGIYFSPVNIINENIISYFGDYNFDNLIGDPRDMWKDNYPDLDNENIKYWRGYHFSANYHEYIRLMTYYDMSLFDAIKGMVPMRSNTKIGVVVEPHILNRSKNKWSPIDYQSLYYTTSASVSTYKDIGGTSLYKSTEIDAITNVSFEKSEFEYLEGIIKNVASKSYVASIGSEKISMYLPYCDLNMSSSCLPRTGSGNGDLIYSPTHYIYNRDYSTGYMNARYGGCLQTSDTTPDKEDPVTITITNPYKLIVDDDKVTRLKVE